MSPPPESISPVESPQLLGELLQIIADVKKGDYKLPPGSRERLQRYLELTLSEADFLFDHFSLLVKHLRSQDESSGGTMLRLLREAHRAPHDPLITPLDLAERGLGELSDEDFARMLLNPQFQNHIRQALRNARQEGEFVESVGTPATVHVSWNLARERALRLKQYMSLLQEGQTPAPPVDVELPHLNTDPLRHDSDMQSFLMVGLSRAEGRLEELDRQEDGEDE